MRWNQGKIVFERRSYYAFEAQQEILTVPSKT
jgi:hypothetical protein